MPRTLSPRLLATMVVAREFEAEFSVLDERTLQRLRKQPLWEMRQ